MKSVCIAWVSIFFLLAGCCKADHSKLYATDAIITGVALDNCATCCNGYIFQVATDQSGANYFSQTLPASDIDFTNASYPISVQMDYASAPDNGCNRRISVIRIRRK